MRVIVIGSGGQLGVDLVDCFGAAGYHVTGLTHQDISIEDEGSVIGALGAIPADIIINAAAYNKVDC